MQPKICLRTRLVLPRRLFLDGSRKILTPTLSFCRHLPIFFVSIDVLEKMAYYAVQYDYSDEHDRGKNYTSVLTDKLVFDYPKAEYHEWWIHQCEHNQAYYSLKNTKSNRCESIRNDPRFIAVVEELKKASK